MTLRRLTPTPSLTFHQRFHNFSFSLKSRSSPCLTGLTFHFIITTEHLPPMHFTPLSTFITSQNQQLHLSFSTVFPTVLDLLAEHVTSSLNSIQNNYVLTIISPLHTSFDYLIKCITHLTRTKLLIPMAPDNKALWCVPRSQEITKTGDLAFKP